MLTKEQIERYWEDGFVVVSGVLDADKIAAYKNRYREIILGDHPPEAAKRIMKDIRIAKGHVPMPDDPEKAVWKILNPDRFDKLFYDYLETPALLDPVESLIGPDILAFLLMFINKPPRNETVHPYHQDAFYFHFEPHDKVLGTWIPLDDADGENGTLSVIRGSHKLEVKEHKTLEGIYNAGAFGVEGFENHPDEVVLDMKAGDCVYFHSRLLHKTGTNVTDRHRRVLTVHMASAACTATGNQTTEYGFRLVRGQNHPGCVAAPDELKVELERSAYK